MILFTMIALSILGKGTPMADEYLLGIQKLIPSFNASHFFDGPVSVSNAPITTPIKIKRPTRDEMVYYNYYTASINSAFGVRTMECDYCWKIKGDIDYYVVMDNTTHDTSVIVALSKKRKEIVVAYRATLNIWNVILDYQFFQSSINGAGQIKFHRGFYIATMSLYDRVVKTIAVLRLQKKEYAAYKLVLAGHSLGAAMARMTEFLLLHLNQFPGMAMEVYTYGEPRGGNKHYVDFLNNQNVKTARITNRADLICHVAPTFLSGSIGNYYYHVLNEYWINGKEEKFADQSVYEDLSCGNSYGPKYTIADHCIYFDVNQARLAADIHQTLALPVVFYPPHVLPPLPKRIRVVLSDVSDTLLRKYTDFKARNG